MKHLRLFFLALAASAAFCLGAATTASSVLDGLRAKITSSPSVEAVFTISGSGNPVRGSVILSGSKFTMTTPQMKAWFDGRTQWTQMAGTKETNITEPDRDELMMTNPFAILTAHKDFYTAKLAKSDAATDVIELTPRSRTSTVTGIVISVNRKTGWPKSLAVTFDDGRKMDIKIDSIAAGARKAASVFTYDARRYPAYEIIDLR